MVRALWTAASGMTSQQTNVDTISNNIANINTTGYKKETAEFKSLLYQKLQEQSYDNNGDPKPYGIQVGLGVRNSGISTQYSQGTLTETGNDFDLAISGKGFFMVRMADGNTAYTRNGAFQMTKGVDGLTLATSDGYPVLDVNKEPITLDETYDANNITFDEYGVLGYPDEDGVVSSIGKQIAIVQFNNQSGLAKQADSLLTMTEASGEPRFEAEDEALKQSVIKQGYLEASNVETVDEMVNLIVAQRAYEMNSKIITAADEMLQQANNLR